MSTEIETLQRLEKKVDELKANLLSQKNVLTFPEMCDYAGISHSHGYKLTHLQKIPGCNKPAGKMMYFDRAELEKWLLTNQVTDEEIETQASTYVALNKRGGRS